MRSSITCFASVTGIGEAVAGVVARAAGDRAVDADHLAADVDERAARVAGVDRRVGLDEVGDRVAVAGSRPGSGRPFALMMPAVTVKSRPSGIADRHDPLARRARLLSSPSGATGRLVPSILITATSVVGSRPITFAVEDALVEQRHRHLVGVGDDVVVREDVAVLRHDEAGAARLLRLARCWGAARSCGRSPRCRRRTLAAATWRACRTRCVWIDTTLGVTWSAIASKALPVSASDCTCDEATLPRLALLREAELREVEARGEQQAADERGHDRGAEARARESWLPSVILSGRECWPSTSYCTLNHRIHAAGAACPHMDTPDARLVSVRPEPSGRGYFLVSSTIS